MSRTNGMGLISPRQSEILKLIGITLWRRRTDHEGVPEVAPSHLHQSISTDQDGSDAGEQGHRWVLAENEPGPIHDTWVICQENARTILTDDSRRRFLEDILLAMGLKFEEVSLFCMNENGTDDHHNRSALHILSDPSHPEPKRLLAFGDQCSEWVRDYVQRNVLPRQSNEKPDVGRVGIDVLLEDNLPTLMADPQRKASLWHQIVASNLCRIIETN